MRAVLQRVRHASVTVDQEEVGAIGAGLLVLAGVKTGDADSDVQWIAQKIAGMRIFPDDQGRMNRSVAEAGAAVLLVSQFTLYGDVRKGRRPSFEAAARPEEAVPRLDELKAALEAAGLRVPTGRFGAHMVVDLINDGPVTILLDSAERRRGAVGAAGGGPEAGPRQRSVADALPGVPLVLASASPRRKVLLAELGLTFTVEPSDVDEKKDVPEDPVEHARILAERKARDVLARHERGLILAADTIVVLDGRIYGKPASENEAVRMLTELAGREHTVMTGVCAANAESGTVATALVQTQVRFHALSMDEIRRYVATGEPMDKAGAYAIQGRGALLVAGITGDYTNVVGLPIGPAMDLLEAVRS
jgi:septum formation protein